MKNLSLTIFCLFLFSFCPNQKAFSIPTDLSIESRKDILPPAPRLMKLKRTLLRNLWMDELIDSKKEFVKMELPKGQIIINGQKLEGKAFKKYENILLNYEITHGEKKEIHIGRKFIKIGVFYEDCFRGQMSGSTSMKFCDDDKKSNKSLF